MSQLKQYYEKEVVTRLMEAFSYSNIMQVPKLDKIILNMGLGEAIHNIKLLDSAQAELKMISGQQPVVTRARKSIAAFKLREGMPIGCMVTLRQDRMYDFYYKLVNIALPRVRDFRGLSPRSMDGNGNYTLGIKEHIIFPEIDYDKIDKIKGLNVSIVTTARIDEEGRELLRLLGMPFRN
jgi:large subunit ribosomal protein L5